MKCPFQLPEPPIPAPHLAFYILAGLTVVLEVIALPLPIYYNQVACFTMWGYKVDCGMADYTRKQSDLGSLACDQLEARFRVITAFSLLGIIFMLAAILMFVFGTLVCTRNGMRWVVFLNALASAISLLIAFGLEAGTFVTDVCRIPGQGSFKDRNWLIASGFPILVTAWAVAVATAAFLLGHDPKFGEQVEKADTA